MAVDFKSYLAKQVIAEQNTVSYRNVSRALKVHVNAAKCMLYEFYEKENKKKSGSIYATYLISGTKRSAQKTDTSKSKHQVEEENVPSSPPPFSSSMLDPSQQSGQVASTSIVPTRTITLVREEVLEDVRKQYDHITSIHLYSISPGRLADIVALTDIGRELFAESLKAGDMLQDNKVYGIIQNPYLKRRKGKRMIIPDAPAPKFQPVKNDKSGPVVKKEQAVQEESRPTSRDTTSTVQSTKPALKKESSNLFKAFAKQKDKPKLARQDTDQSTNALASGIEDSVMKDADDEGESEDDTLFPTSQGTNQKTKKRPSEVKKERDDRAAKLRKMMDSDDEEKGKDPEEDVASGESQSKEEILTPAAKGEDDDADEVEWSASDSEKKKEAGISEPRRRRGKRKVMKKRTFTDEGGFFVTQEEAAWESFSEDEPEPKSTMEKERKKPVANTAANVKTQDRGATAPSSTAEGGKKKGNIMSFFGKK